MDKGCGTRTRNMDRDYADCRGDETSITNNKKKEVQWVQEAGTGSNMGGHVLQC